MQTHIQQMSKKNKVTVPFYSPPFRLHGQTPADIIKEARAAVLLSSPIRIKPVHTSRPFTPNEKERTLFGKVKKINHRPPSSFSLRHLKNQEPISHVKLPTIEIVSRRKNYPTIQLSKNLSLDNLTEDYDAEIFEEFESIDQKKLPPWNKILSYSKAGRLTKFSSLNDLSHPFVEGNKSNKINQEENLISFKKGNLEVYVNFVDSHETSEDHFKLLHDEGSSEEYMQNPVTTKEESVNEISLSNKNLAAGSSIQKNRHKDYMQPAHKNKDNEGQITENLTLNESVGKHEKILAFKEFTDESKYIQGNKIEIKEKKEFKEENKSGKTVNIAEKSVLTESKSEYLTSLKAGSKGKVKVKHSESAPLELLQLYETAQYYGVDVSSNNAQSPAVTNLDKHQFVRKEEGCCWRQKSSGLYQQNVNFKKLEKKVIVSKLKWGTSKKSEMNDALRKTPESEEFVMNNKKRYHMVGDRGGIKEKAYKVWNHKQEVQAIAPEAPLLNNNWDIFWKNSYFEEKSDTDETIKKGAGGESLQQLLNKINVLVKKGADSHLIYETTSQLYGLIKSNTVHIDSKLKASILRCLYMCVDIENAEVLLSLAKIFFYFKEENSLSVACKIIFKVARLDTNDDLFLHEEDILELFLEGIGRAPPLECAESCIYSYGALKFLTLNHNILSRILHLGALDLMTLHLKMINNAHAEHGSVGEQTQHALFQLTGALRHVAAGEGALPLFLTTNCITIVCNTLRQFFKDEDVIVNISRTLSLLSTDETVTQVLMQVDNILITLIDLMERYKENDKILIRLAFCLGNIVEHSDLARVQLSRSDAAVNILLSVLKIYIDKDLELSLEEGDRQTSDDLDSEVIDDVIVKVIRIIANMSMNPIVGSNLSPATKEKKSLQLSKLLSVLLMRKDPGITLLATLGCLNNISYYCNTHSALMDLTQGVERVLALESVECQTEAARVLGNLTRHREIRDLIYSTGGVNLLIKLLSSSDQEVVRCTCGTLVNMLLDSETRKFFVKAQGIDKLMSALEVFPGDWSLAGLATRAIWNSCADDVPSVMLHNDVEHLLNFLASSLEEENWNDGDSAWEEFASVATDLLEKISLHLDYP